MDSELLPLLMAFKDLVWNCSETNISEHYLCTHSWFPIISSQSQDSAIWRNGTIINLQCSMSQVPAWHYLIRSFLLSVLSTWNITSHDKWCRINDNLIKYSHHEAFNVNEELSPYIVSAQEAPIQSDLPLWPFIISQISWIVSVATWGCRGPFPAAYAQFRVINNAARVNSFLGMHCFMLLRQCLSDLRRKHLALRAAKDFWLGVC